MNSQSNLLSQKKTAEFFQVSVRTLIEWRKKGIIKAAKIGRVVRYDPVEIKRVVKENSTQQRNPKRKYF